MPFPIGIRVVGGFGWVIDDYRKSPAIFSPLAEVAVNT